MVFVTDLKVRQLLLFLFVLRKNLNQIFLFTLQVSFHTGIVSNLMIHFIQVFYSSTPEVTFRGCRGNLEIVLSTLDLFIFFSTITLISGVMALSLI